MKQLAKVEYDPAKGALELREFGDLLTARAELAERADIQQFFKQHRHLCALMGTCGPHGAVADCLAFEFPIVGDFTADLVVGNRTPRAFLLIELEDAKQNSVFTQVGQRAARDWSQRFNHGFSQIIDWFCSLDDFKRTRRLHDVRRSLRYPFVPHARLGRRHQGGMTPAGHDFISTNVKSSVSRSLAWGFP